jgi:hypothetical protein
LVVAVAALSAATPGCASEQEPGATGAAGPGAGGGSTSASGGPSSGTGGVPCPDGELCLDPPAQGFQVKSKGDTIQPGQDVEYCEVVQLPGDPSETYYVNRLEAAMTKYSHHLIVVAVEPGSATEKNVFAGKKEKCFQVTTFGEDVEGVTGSQLPYRDEIFPDGVGKIYKGGQLVIFDYHYLNTTGAPIKAAAAVNFHTVDASKIKKISQGFGFFNFNIYVPPNDTASFTKDCAFSQDVVVYKLVRHTHRWGTEFPIRFRGGPKDGELVWTSKDYEDVDHMLPEPVLMKAGTGFEFTCNYNNTTPDALTFGVKATDEMCILFGQWFVVNEGDPVTEQGCG